MMRKSLLGLAAVVTLALTTSAYAHPQHEPAPAAPAAATKPAEAAKPAADHHHHDTKATGTTGTEKPAPKK